MKRPDQRSDAAKAYRVLYRTPQWKQLRTHQLRQSPLCAMCKSMGSRVEATVADHIKPHKGNAVLFYDPRNIQSLCATHHNSHKQRRENGRVVRIIGTDGWPVDDPGGG